MATATTAQNRSFYAVPTIEQLPASWGVHSGRFVMAKENCQCPNEPWSVTYRRYTGPGTVSIDRLVETLTPILKALIVQAHLQYLSKRKRHRG